MRLARDKPRTEREIASAILAIGVRLDDRRSSVALVVETEMRATLKRIANLG